VEECWGGDRGDGVCWCSERGWVAVVDVGTRRDKDTIDKGILHSLVLEFRVSLEVMEGVGRCSEPESASK
jgi:hypothetical protein